MIQRERYILKSKQTLTVLEFFSSRKYNSRPKLAIETVLSFKKVLASLNREIISYHTNVVLFVLHG